MVAIEDIIERSELEFIAKYRSFIADLSLPQFLELRRLINIDYERIQAITQDIGLKELGVTEF